MARAKSMSCSPGRGMRHDCRCVCLPTHLRRCALLRALLILQAGGRPVHPVHQVAAAPGLGTDGGLAPLPGPVRSLPRDGHVGKVQGGSIAGRIKAASRTWQRPMQRCSTGLAVLSVRTRAHAPLDPNGLNVCLSLTCLPSPAETLPHPAPLMPPPARPPTSNTFPAERPKRCITDTSMRFMLQQQQQQQQDGARGGCALLGDRT